MFTGEHNRKRYTAGDIHRYHSGLMSPAERNALEKAALEDPFLEEALEGYAHAADPTNDLTILRSRLDERVRRKRGSFVVFIRAWGAAAAVLVLVLLGGGIFIRYLGRHPKQAPIAIKKAPPSQEETESRIAPAADTVAMVLPRHRQKPKPIPQGDNLISQPAETYAKPDTTETRRFADSLQDRQAGVAVAPSLPQVRLDSQERLYNNRVLDNHNQPVAFATVHPLNSKSGVVSDANGYFKLPLNDTNAIVSVSAVGYATRHVNTSQKTPIQLDQLNNNLSDVVVVALDNKKATPAETKRANGPYHAIADSSDMEPIDGWDDYNHYITTSLHLPDEVLRKNLHGDVGLSFQVDKDGNPIHVNVVQSLCDRCDAEAKRLLLQGPQWKKKGKGRRGWLRVHF